MPSAVHEIPEDRLHDPREESEFFSRLPEAAKQEFRERWRREEGRDGRSRELRRSTFRAYVAEMVCAFVFFHLFGILQHPVLLPIAVVGGAATGAVAAWARAGTLLYPVIAALGYVGSGGFNPFGALAILGLASMLGFEHRLRRFEGLEV